MKSARPARLAQTERPDPMPSAPTPRESPRSRVEAASGEAPFAYSGLDRILHERGRLGVLTCLVAFPEGLSFSDLRDECGLTDGNLNRHLQALADVGIVALRKVRKRKIRGGRPITMVTITAVGRERFLAYIDALETVVRDAHARAGAIGELESGAAESGLATT